MQGCLVPGDCIQGDRGRSVGAFLQPSVFRLVIVQMLQLVMLSKIFVAAIRARLGVGYAKPALVTQHHHLFSNNVFIYKLMNFVFLQRTSNFRKIFSV